MKRVLDIAAETSATVWLLAESMQRDPHRNFVWTPVGPWQGACPQCKFTPRVLGVEGIDVRGGELHYVKKGYIGYFKNDEQNFLLCDTPFHHQTSIQHVSSLFGSLNVRQWDIWVS